MSRVTIMQPAYLPWLGYFDRIASADRLIVLDHVAMDRNSRTKFANRNRVKGANGPIWLTLPIVSKGARDMPINELRINDAEDWRRKHLATLEASYRKAEFHKDIAALAAEMIETPAETLVDVTNPMLKAFMSQLGLTTPVEYSGETGAGATGSDLILELCRKAGASSYISGPFGRDYLDLSAFADEGIEVVFHDYRHPTYRQLHGDFTPYMSVIDLLFNEGPRALDILTTGSGSLSPR